MRASANPTASGDLSLGPSFPAFAKAIREKLGPHDFTFHEREGESQYTNRTSIRVQTNKGEVTVSHSLGEAAGNMILFVPDTDRRRLLPSSIQINDAGKVVAISCHDYSRTLLASRPECHENLESDPAFSGVLPAVQNFLKQVASAGAEKIQRGRVDAETHDAFAGAVLAVARDTRG